MSGIEDIVPGSLAARVLDHMRIAKGEFEPGELADALQADLGEIRHAMGTLRKACQVTTRLEEGHPIYRAAGTKPSTIPGSGMKVIVEKKPAPETKTAKRETEPSMPKTETTAASPADSVLAFIEAHPGGCSRADIQAGTKLTMASTKKALNDLSNRSAIKLQGWTKNARWYLTSEKVDAAAAPAPKKRAAAKATTEKAPTTKKGNLALYGAPAPVPKAKVNGRPGFDFAISSDGAFAIRPRGNGESVKMAPADVREMIVFLELTQHVWKGAQA